MKKTLNDIVFLIPSLDPDERLCPYIKELAKAGAKHILLVDDGSHAENQKYFDEALKSKKVEIVRHAVNQGKGRGLKTGINYILLNYPNVKGVVTADSDGQHSCSDTIATAYKLLETNSIVLGTRNFNDPSVPFKSRNGNKITTKVFKMLYGKVINDTQTGLRGLPVDFLEDCMKLPGERFEYEIQMLIKMVKAEREIVELPIETIYDSKENHQTHFNPVKDSIKIYRVMFASFFAYVGASLFSAAIDIGLFALLILIPFKSDSINILVATIGARIVSSLINYSLNKNTVFKSERSVKDTIVKYYLLAGVRMLASWALVTVVYYALHLDKTLIKTIIEVVLFVVTFDIQNKYIFKE